MRQSRRHVRKIFGVDSDVLRHVVKDDPLAVMGSANYSKPSQPIDDKDMLIACGNTRVADNHFGGILCFAEKANRRQWRPRTHAGDVQLKSDDVA